MKKKLTAMVLCLLMIAQLTAPTAQAEEDIYFVAAHNVVQPLTDETMPFWADGYLYIPASIFNSSVWGALGVTLAYTDPGKAIHLYRDMNQFLQFDLEKGYAIDSMGQITYPACIVRNGQHFVSAYQVAKYFDLVYTVTEVEHGHLVWLRKEDFGLTDRAFANAASYMISQYYDDYIQSKAEPIPSTPPSTPGTPSAPEGPVTPVDPAIPEKPEIKPSGRNIYLCLTADENTGPILDVLDQYGAQAAFFCDADFLAQQGSLLRRMTAAGHSIALLIDADDPTLSVEEQLTRGNALLKQATFGATRLVRLANGGPTAEDLVRAAGFRRLGGALDRSGHSLRTSSHANTLLQRLTSLDNRAVVWLGSSANAAGLRAFLRLSEQAGHRCLAWTEIT